MAHFFKHMPIRQISRKYSKFLTVRPVIGPSLTVHFAEKYLNLENWCAEQCLRLNITESKILHSYVNNGNTKKGLYF